MRRQTLLIAAILATLPCLPVVSAAQDSTPASGSSTRHELEEYYKAVNSRLEDLAADNESLRKQIYKLKEEVQKLSDDVSRAKDPSKDASTAESLKMLKKAIEEVDSKRLEDHKLVLAEFEKLGRLLKEPITKKNPSGGNDVKPPTPPKTTDNPPKTAEGGSYYQIRDGDTLDRIVTALRKGGVKITMKQVMDANLGVNWNRLRIGQQIFLPGVIPP